MRTEARFIGALALFAAVSGGLVACAGGKASARRDKLGPRHEDEAPPPAPVTMTLVRVTSAGKEIAATHNVLLISDTVLQVKVVNHTGSALYLKVEQTPDKEGALPLEPPTSSSFFSDRDGGLYKLSSDENGEIDFPIQHGLRDGHATLSLLGDSDGAKSYAEAGVVMRVRPALEFYGDDDSLVKTVEGTPQFELNRAAAATRKNFFVEMVPGPPDAATCTIAVESLSEDGTLLSQVVATLGAPAYRDGPFHAIDGDEVLPNTQRYRRHNLVEGDPADSATSPAPRDHSDLIATGEIRVRRIVCR